VWRFLSKLHSLFRVARHPPEASAEDAEFTFREQPAIPAGLEGLRVERLPPGHTLLLTGFDAVLTVDQTYLDDTLARIASATRSLRWAAKSHGLDAGPAPPVRLHRGNVVLLPRHLLVPAAQEAVASLTAWLARFAWDAGRTLLYQQSSTDRPVEDGFLRCVRVLAVGSGTEPDGGGDGLVWEQYDPGSGGLPDVLTRFMEGEVARVAARPGGCERFLVDCYRAVPADRLTHPAFALLDFPIFDMGCVEVEFAGSVWSPDELRFWSRPAYFHK
jgi:hypothetical protein